MDRMVSTIASQLKEGSLDPFNDDAVSGIPGGEEAAAWIVVELAGMVVTPQDPEAIQEGARALSNWLGGGEVPVSRLVQLCEALLTGGFGDLYCFPACCWTSTTAKAYLVAAGIHRVIKLTGYDIDVAQRLYGAQYLAEVIRLIDGVSPSQVRDDLRERLIKRCEGVAEP